MTAEYREQKEAPTNTDLNVVILPDTETRDRLVSWSNTLADTFPTLYRLNSTDKLPHFSLYSAQYPAKNIPTITEQLSQIAQESGEMEAEFDGFSIFSGYVFYDALKTDPIMTLHERVVDSLNPLREGQISDVQRSLTGLTAAQQQAIDEYGYVSVKDLYMPHISITKLPNDELAREAIAVLPHEKLSFRVGSIALAPFAPLGLCPGIIQEFPFRR